MTTALLIGKAKTSARTIRYRIEPLKVALNELVIEPQSTRRSLEKMTPKARARAAHRYERAIGTAIDHPLPPPPRDMEENQKKYAYNGLREAQCANQSVDLNVNFALPPTTSNGYL